MGHNPIILNHMEQGSDEWRLARMGCVTMSKAKNLLTGGKGVTRETYIIEVASELISGQLAENISTWDMERGIMLEPYAVRAYESLTGLEVQTIGLGYLNEDRRIAASPDGLTMIGGMEVKCQKPKNHLKTIIEAKNPKQFEAQMQGCMWVFDVDTWDYCSFCPEFNEQPLFILTMRRNEEMIKAIEDAAHKAVEGIDNYVRIASAGRASEELKEICAEANELIDIITGKDVGIL